MPAAILAGTLPGGVNLFSSPPPNPRINDPHAPKPPPFPSIPRRRAPKPPPRNPNSNSNPNPNPNPKPGLKAHHTRTKYHKPVSRGVLSSDGDRSVIVGDSGISYLLPGAPFEFQFSYSEAPKETPLAVREPAFLPFGPPTMPRPWTGKAPLKSKREKALKKQRRVSLVESEVSDDAVEGGEGVGKVMEMSRAVEGLVPRGEDGRSRKEILGKPLSRVEVRKMIQPFLSSNRQVNLGRDGLTHNMLEMIHGHWKRHPICKVRCRGVPTVDMDNVCHHLEEKTWGKILHRVGGVVYLFRGRNYDPQTRPRYPLMLWKPAAPVYPKLIQEAPGGLTKIEANDLRERGKKLLPICKLAKNGIYISLVKDVRDAFEESPLVKINCQGLEPSDYKKIGAKLKDLVPCVLLSFDEEQILIWRGQNWKSKYQILHESGSGHQSSERDSKAYKLDDSDELNIGRDMSPRKEISNSITLKLWNHALRYHKALLLDSTDLSPDALLEKVEEFSLITQAKEHSYPAIILPASDGNHLLEENGDTSQVSDERDVYDDIYNEDVESDTLDKFDDTVPFGSLPLDILAKRLDPE